MTPLLNTERKKILVLGLLLAAWVLLVITRVSPTGTNKPARSLPSANSTVAEKRGGPGEGEIPRFKQYLLDLPLPPYKKEHTNLFGAPPPLPPPPPPPVVAPPPPPPDPFYEEVKQYKFVGSSAGQGGPQAFLSKGTDLFIVKVNDTLGTLYVVKEIHQDALTLRSPAGDKEVTLSSSGGTGGSRPTPPRP